MIKPELREAELLSVFTQLVCEGSKSCRQQRAARATVQHPSAGTFLIAVTTYLTTRSFMEGVSFRLRAYAGLKSMTAVGEWGRERGGREHGAAVHICTFKDGRQNGVHNLKVHTPVAHFLVKALPPKGSRTFQNRVWKET